MNFFDKLAGKKPVIPTTAETIQKLRNIEDMLIKKQEHLESKIEREQSTAIKYASNNKKVALQALRRKKRYEKQLQQIDNTVTTLEMQREALDVANTNTTVLKTMKNAADILKTTHLNVDIDKIYGVMDNIADQNDLVNEIATAISSPVGFHDDIDEDELEKELENLEEELLGDKLEKVPSFKLLPAVPTGTIAKAGTSKSKSKNVNKDDDEDVEKLEKWAS